MNEPPAEETAGARSYGDAPEVVPDAGRDVSGGQPDAYNAPDTWREQYSEREAWDDGSGYQPSGSEPQTDAQLYPAEERASFGRWLLEMVLLVAVAFLLASGIKQFVVQPFIIPSLSMAPTLQINDRVLVNKFIYRFESPESGDIVVFLEPGSEKTDYIKRVIAVEGQTVDVREGRVFVDGEELVEPYTHGAATEPGDVRLPVTIPKDHVWLMGDNRGNSRDSRWFGPQPVARVLGEAFAIYWPPQRVSGF